jgi:hypothetical protein
MDVGEHEVTDTATTCGARISISWALNQPLPPTPSAHGQNTGRGLCASGDAGPDDRLGGGQGLGSRRWHRSRRGNSTRMSRCLLIIALSPLHPWPVA